MTDFFDQAERARELKNQGYNQTQIAKEMKCSKAWMTQLMRADRLPSDVRKLCKRGILSPQECTREFRRGAATEVQLEEACDLLKEQFVLRDGVSLTTEYIRIVEDLRKGNHKTSRRTLAEVDAFLSDSTWTRYPVGRVMLIVNRWFEGKLAKETAVTELAAWASARNVDEPLP